EIIFEMLDKNYDISTIYRNLNFFVENNLIRTIVFSDKVTYYYSGKGHFHYIYCVKCKKFEKINMCYEEKLAEYIEKNLEFKVLDHTLYFEGICKECRNGSV
ncbi:MAG TPA: transcriptional repressor, partial [Tepiditoga sp.]|nr:transcriptional repressor [Tepiditoga sp.]